MKRVLQFKALNFLLVLILMFSVTSMEGQASLPVNESFSAITSTVGPLQAGFSQTGLNGYVTTQPYALKFDTQGDFLQLYFTGTPGLLSFDLGLNNNFTSTIPSTATFSLLESSDGTNFTSLAIYSNVVCGTKSISNINSATRYLKWVYTIKPSGSNISLKNISLAASSAAPTITGAATTAVFTTTFGTASAAQQFPVSGSNLTADLIATAPTGFEVSSDGTNYNSTATFTQTAGAASGTLYIRLSANAAVGTTIYDNQNIVLSSTGATSVNITTPASGNAVTAAALQNQTISFAAFAPVTYGAAPFTLSASSSSGLTLFTYSSSNPAVATVSGNTITVVGAGSTIITASQAGDANYNPGSAQQTLLVNQKPVTIANALASNKVYDGTNTAVLSGTLNGIETADAVNVSLVLTGTFASVDVADGIAVTSTSTLSGTAATNYSLTQPTGLIANITAAPQSITFSSLAPKVVGELLTLSAFSSTSAVNPISFSSSNPLVATIAGNVVTILASGTTTITASQGGSANYSEAQTSQTLNVLDALAKWTFETPDFSATPSQTPVLSVGTPLAEFGASVTGSEFTGFHASSNTVWSTPVGNASSNSFSSNNWSVGDYLQFKVASQNFYDLSVSYDQTGSSTGPKDFKFQYSTDGINFTDFGSDYVVNSNTAPNAWSGSTYYSLFTNTINLNAIAVINNKPFVYFRIVNTTTTSINNGTTASGGANRIDNFTVTGSLCPTITSTFSSAPAATTCISSITSYTTEAGQYNYLWTIPGVAGIDYTIVTGGQSASNSVAIQWLTAGPKTVTVNYANSNGCTSSVASNTTIIQSVPTFSVTNPAAVCAPATVNLNATVSNTALSYQFYSDANASTIYPTPSTAIAGTYYIIGGDGTCYTAPQAVTVTVNALPVFTVTNPAAVCAPATVDLNATVSNTALSYQFYSDANATTLYTTPTAATAGTYYIIGGNGSCYTAPQAVTVTVNALPTFTVTNPAAVCAPATVNLNATVSNSVLSYQFYSDANASTIYPTPTVATAGTYYIIGGNGTCYTAPQSVTVTVNALPVFTVTNPAAVCAPATVDLNATVSNTALSYQFYSDANATTLYTTPTTATAGTYYIIGGNGSCYTAPQAVTVIVNPLPIVAAITGTTSVDVNANTTLASTTPGGVWSSSNMSVATVNPNGVVSGVTQGTATIYYTVTTGGCSGSQSVLVTVNALGLANFDRSSLVFYPNPTQDVINFTYKDAITEVEVYNVLGQKVLQTVPNATSAAVNVSNLAAGTYLVKLFSGEFFTTVRVIKN